jgi:hypothetical protein
MKAHIRKIPTKETYLMNLGRVIDKLDYSKLLSDTAMSLKVGEAIKELGSEENYEKMKKALGGADDE